VGMYIGIDGYNPTRARLFKNASLNGQLEVERRWYMEMLWADFLQLRRVTTCSGICWRPAIHGFQPEPFMRGLCFAVIAQGHRTRHERVKLDFTGIRRVRSDPGRCTGFRTIDDGAGAKGGLPSRCCQRFVSLHIADSAAGICKARNPRTKLPTKCRRMPSGLVSGQPCRRRNADLEVAINNVKQMAYLSAYYAHKIRRCDLQES